LTKKIGQVLDHDEVLQKGEYYILDERNDSQMSAFEKGEVNNLIEYFQKQSYSVDVLVENKEMMTMMVPKLPHHKNLNLIKNTMIAFEEEVDRTNAKTKCLGLYENSSMMIKELYYTNMFQNDTVRYFFINKIIGLIPRFENFWILIN